MKPDALLVYGEGFLFSVKEHRGWVSDTESAARIGANISFHPAGQKRDKDATIIRVLIAKKVDENTADDLAHDMAGYKRNFPKIKFEDVKLTHPSYRVFPKLFTVPGKFQEYVAYVNPGPKHKLMFSASMNKQKTPASKEELGAYQEIISSLVLLPKSPNPSTKDPLKEESR